MLISYFLFMGLLIVTLVLWAILALREETPADQEPERKSAEEEPKETVNE